MTWAETFPLARSLAHHQLWLFHKHLIMSISNYYECCKASTERFFPFVDDMVKHFIPHEREHEQNNNKKIKEKKKFLLCLVASSSLVNLQHTECDRCMNLWNWYHLENVKSNINRNYILRVVFRIKFLYL